MLDSLRNIGRTWYGKALGILLLVGLTGFGVSGVILDFGSSTVARVGDEEISSRQFQRAYNDDLQRITRQFGQQPGPQEALALGIPSGTLSRLSAEAAINQLATRMGLGVSEDRLSVMLRDDPTFSGTLGQFDRATFTRVLQQLGYTEAEYFDLQTKASRRQQMSAGLFADSPIPAAAEELLERFTADTRTIDYFVINEASMLPVEDPTDDEIAAYLAEHQNEFRTDETRTADVLVLSIDTLAATRTVTDEDVAAEYEATKASRAAVEKRTIRQAPLSAEQVAAFEAGRAAGKTFDELVAENGVAVTDVGTLGKSEVLDPNLANAAFGLAAAGDFAIIPGIGGQRAVNVSAIQEGGDVPLEAVRDEIRASLAARAARAEYNDILDQIEELRAAFQPLPDIAARFGLDLETVAVTASGAALADVPGVPADSRGRVAGEIFDAEEGQLAPTVRLSGTSHVWFDLKGIEPVRDQTLDEVRDDVVAAITAERTAASIAAEVEGILAELRAGNSLADVALVRNQFPTLSQPMTRDGDGTPVLNASVTRAAFAGGEGHFGSAVNGEGDNVVFQVVEITPSGGGAIAQARAYLEETTRQSLYSDFVAGLRNEYGVRQNDQVLNQLLALDTTGQ